MDELVVHESATIEKSPAAARHMYEHRLSSSLREPLIVLSLPRPRPSQQLTFVVVASPAGHQASTALFAVKSVVLLWGVLA